MSFHEFLFPLLAILIPIIVLFAVRGLDKGRNHTVTKTNLTYIEKESERQRLNQTTIFNMLATIQADIRINANGTAQIIIDIDRLSERIRQIELEMARRSR